MSSEPWQQAIEAMCGAAPSVVAGKASTDDLKAVFHEKQKAVANRILEKERKRFVIKQTLGGKSIPRAPHPLDEILDMEAEIMLQAYLLPKEILPAMTEHMLKIAREAEEYKKQLAQHYMEHDIFPGWGEAMAAADDFTARCESVTAATRSAVWPKRSGRGR